MLAVAYVVVLAVTVFSPTSQVQWSAVVWVHEHLRGMGVPYWVSSSAVEFVSNVVLFVPLSFLGLLLWDRWGWLAWVFLGFLATSVTETGQMVFLSERSPAMSDIVANTVGALCGALLALPVRARLRRQYDARREAQGQEQSPGVPG